MPIAAALKTGPALAGRRSALPAGKRGGMSAHGASLRAMATARPFGPAQAKVTVGPANDRFEQEADRVADHVMRMPASEVASGAPPPADGAGPPSISRLPGTAPIHRMCSECEEELHRKSAADTAQRLCAHCDAELSRKPADAAA